MCVGNAAALVFLWETQVSVVCVRTCDSTIVETRKQALWKNVATDHDTSTKNFIVTVVNIFLLSFFRTVDDWGQ